jgi:hypothetical protein
VVVSRVPSVAWTKAAIRKRRVTVDKQAAKVCPPHNPPREAEAVVVAAEVEAEVPAAAVAAVVAVAVVAVAVVEDKEGRI